MLNGNAIVSTLPLAEQLDAAGVILVPKGGTPLDHLVQASCVNTDAIIKTDGQNGYLIDTFEIERQSNAIVEPFEQSRHDYVADDIAAVGGNAVQNVISVIRNRIAPSIGELVELVTMRMNATPVSTLANIKITANEGAGALFSPALARLIEKFALTPPMEPSMNLALPRLSAAEIVPLLETGISSFDSEAHDWIASLPPSTLETIWEVFFSTETAREGTGGDATIARRQDPFNSLVDGWDCARLAVFLISRNLLENDVVLDGTEMNLGTYRGTLQTYMQQSGRLLNRQVEKLTSSVQNGVLVNSINYNEIVVNTPVYNTWLENGGDNEVLFGMAMSGSPTFLIGTLTERADEFRALWKRQVQLLTAADSNTRFNYLREQLVLCYESMLSKEDHDGVQYTPHEVQVIMKEFKKQLDGLSIEETQDVYRLCLKLICRTRYVKLPAERFLLKMDEVAKADPTLSPRETATIATIEYICDWVADQFVVVAA